MIRNYFTSIVRYISHNKSLTFINILGLAIGMMACMLISQYVMHEFSYDDFHVKKNRIFRIQQDRYNQGKLSSQWAAGCAAIGPELKTHFAEVESYARLFRNNGILASADVAFKEDAMYFASEDFFKIFSVKLILGEDSAVLKGQNKIVLSQSLAKKYFGNEDPIGKILEHNGGEDYQVSGVFEDLPVNTHMRFDALMSFSTLEKREADYLMSWEWDGFSTYILLNENADRTVVEAKLPELVDTQAGELLKGINEGMQFHLQPVTDIHLDSDFIGEFKSNGSRQSARFLTIIYILILMIAWVNYINLSTAKSIERAREVGVRKVMGGFRSQLIQQFLFESIFLNVAAFIISILLVILLTPTFSELTGRELSYLLFKRNSFWIWTGVLIFGGALLAGVYPAFVLSSYKPVEMLKGRFKNTHSGVLFRRGMVLAQFVSSITLITGTFTVYRQIHFMQKQELGVNINQTLVVRSPGLRDSTYQLYLQKFQVFKQKIEQYPEVVAVSAASEIPGRRHSEEGRQYIHGLTSLMECINVPLHLSKEYHGC